MKGITLALAAAIAGMTTLASTAQQLAVPSSVQLQHAQIIGRLESYAQQDGPAAAAAGKAVAFLKSHYAKETEFVLLPLGLLSGLFQAFSRAR